MMERVEKGVEQRNRASKTIFSPKKKRLWMGKYSTQIAEGECRSRESLGNLTERNEPI